MISYEAFVDTQLITGYNFLHLQQEIQHFGHTRSDSEPSDDETDQCDGSDPVRHILPEGTLQSRSKPNHYTKGNIASKFKMVCWQTADILLYISILLHLIIENAMMMIRHYF